MIDDLEQALYASKMVSYAQGYQLMREVAAQQGWKLNYGGIALMWRGGCIIRSAFLGKIKQAFDTDAGLVNLLLDPFFKQAVEAAQTGWRRVVATAVRLGIPVPAISAALAYFDGYRRKDFPQTCCRPSATTSAPIPTRELTGPGVSSSTPIGRAMGGVLRLPPMMFRSNIMTNTAEHQRLQDHLDRKANWKKWGPYVSERAWGTVREDYSADGSAWEYFPHDHARSRAYRWGEDGIAGICDRHQYVCLALSLWNHNDPILKERLFGLTGSQGNHGEDVKEYYFYLDATPTHSYLKMLYKYPHAAFPYADLVAENGRRGFNDFEYELSDTGIFDDQRYFDVFVEYAKAGTDDILIKITAFNRGPEAAPLDVLPTVWFRNTWSPGYVAGPMGDVPEPPGAQAGQRIQRRTLRTPFPSGGR